MRRGAELELKPLSVVVLDAGGHVISFERQDDAAPGRFAIANGKAYGAIMLGMAGTAQMARAEHQAYFMEAINDVLEVRLSKCQGAFLLGIKKAKSLER